MNVVDSSAWLEYLAAAPNATYFGDAIEKTAELIVPSVSIYEVFKKILQQSVKGHDIPHPGVIKIPHPIR